jgi:hypothetical protein
MDGIDQMQLILTSPGNFFQGGTNIFKRAAKVLSSMGRNHDDLGRCCRPVKVTKLIQGMFRFRLPGTLRHREQSIDDSITGNNN